MKAPEYMSPYNIFAIHILYEQLLKKKLKWESAFMSIWGLENLEQRQKSTFNQFE